jgi:alpha-tubulin suppressor-like RCC1 family protein
MNLKKIFATLIFGIIGILSSKAQVRIEAYGHGDYRFNKKYNFNSGVLSCLAGQTSGVTGDYFLLEDLSLRYYGTDGKGKNIIDTIEGPWRDFGEQGGIKTDGTLWKWGNNTYFQYPAKFDTVPRQIGTDTDWNKIFATQSQIFAIKTDGTLWSFGYNGHYSLGLDRNVVKQDTNWGRNILSSPRQVGTDTDWDAVYSHPNKRFTLARKTNGNIWAWGRNNHHMGFDSSVSYVERPTLLLTGNWKDISIGYRHILALKSDSTLWTWGEQAYKSPVGTPIYNQRTPMKIEVGSYPKSYIEIATGPEISGALTNINGEVSLQLFGVNFNSERIFGTIRGYIAENEFSIVDFDISENNIILLVKGKENARILTKYRISNPVIFYPNPANDIIHVVVKSDFIGTSYEITSITGQKISKGNIEREDTAISIQNLVKGIYLIHLGDDIQQSFKIIKK